MKFLKIYLAALFVFTALQNYSQTTKIIPCVDERTELLSIVFRLAEVNEFVNNHIESYAQKTDKYFQNFRNDDLINYAKKIRNENSVSYDAVMSMAVHLQIINSTIKLKDDISKISLDNRWGNNALEFVSLLNVFYKKSNFHQFFIDNKTIYSLTEKRFSEAIKNIDFNWFDKFYGTPPEGTFNLIISLSNGGMSYGPKMIHKNATENMFAIIGAYETDSMGNPICTDDFYETVVHEFNHSYCNHLMDKFYPEMQKQAEEFYELVKEKMQPQAYTTPITMLYEILVRAAVIKYFQEHNASQIKINQLTCIEQSGGFIWIDKLVNVLTEYENSRAENLTLEQFMPKIVTLQNSLKPLDIYKNIGSNLPQIITMSIKNNDQNLDPLTNKIILTFDRPMDSTAYGIQFGACGEDCLPKISSVKWDSLSNTQFTISVKLEPNKMYEMIFPELFFFDKNGFVLRDDYLLNFRTKSK